MRKRGPLSLHHKILLVLALGLFAPFLAVTWVSYRASTEIISDDAREQQERVLLALSRDIWSLQDQSRKQLAVLGSAPGIQAALLGREALPSSLVTTFLKLNPHWTELAFFDAHGRTVWRSGEAGTTPQGDPTSATQSAPEPPAQLDPFFLETFSLRSSQTPVERTPDGYRTRLGLCLEENLQFLGVIAASLDLSIVDRRIKLMRRSSSLSALVWDDRGTVFASGFRQDELTNLTRQVDLRSVGREVLSSQGGPVYQTVELPTGRVAFSVMVLPEVISRLEPVPGEHWFVGLAVPYASAYQKLWAFQTRLLVFLAVLFSAVTGVLLWMGRRVTTPMRQMARFAGQVAEGQREILLRVDRDDELGRLADSLNSMAKSLESYERELVRSEVLASLGKMSSIVAHEIRNPLNAIKGAAQHLQISYPDNELVVEYGKLIDQKVNRLVSFVDNLLRLARLPQPELREVSLASLLRMAVEPYRARLESQKVIIECRDLEGVVLKCDEEQVTELVQNLLQNSLDAMSEGGIFGVLARRLTDSVEVEFFDNGPGISPETRRKLFVPFASGKTGGNGLGLVLCRMIAESHRGSFDFKETEVGACFVLRLPN